VNEFIVLLSTGKATITLLSNAHAQRLLGGAQQQEKRVPARRRKSATSAKYRSAMNVSCVEKI
jgi:hypothetical protein